MKYNILLVDDDIKDIAVIEELLNRRMNCRATVVNSGEQAIDMLNSNSSDNFDLVLLDLSMPGVDGLEVLKSVKPMNPDLPVIVRTGFDDVDMAINAMRAGATDFVKKLDDPERLQASINNALRINTLNNEINRLKNTITGAISFDDIIGESPAVQEMVKFGKKVAASHIPVLLEGESGCGKEYMAQAIHAASDCADNTFVAVNCGAIPENLVESILFGHEKGAFTGAVYKSLGKFREAEGGTIFLDEVGELTPDIQVKLLRVLQDGEIDPVGSKKPVKVNVRVISATNRNLAEEVKLGHFREDLYYRLNVFPINVPSLRHRMGDIHLLMDHFSKTFIASEGKPISGICDDARELLSAYHWPGNIRQLKNTMYRAVVLCEKDKLEVEDFPQVQAAMAGGLDAAEPMLSDATTMAPQPSLAVQPTSNIMAPLCNDIMHLPNGHFRTLKEMERDIITAALTHYRGHMSEVARKLGIGRSTLYRKIKDLDVDVDSLGSC